MKKMVAILFCIVLLFNNITLLVNANDGNTLFYNKKIPENDILKYNLDFNKTIELLIKIGHIPSLSACVIKNNTSTFFGFGHYNLKNDATKPTPDTVYEVASVTKTITATAIMQLIENETYNLSLDDNVSKYLPFDLKNPKYPDVNITFRMLLAHESSLNNCVFIQTAYFLLLNIPKEWFSEYLIPGGIIYNKNSWKDYSPGHGVNYSNFNMDILGYLAELISKQPYEEYCQEHIFKPLNMTNSSFYLKDLDKNQLSVPYTYLIGKYFRIPYLQCGTLSASGGLYSTASDLSHFLIAYMNNGVYDGKRILKNETVNEMKTLQYPSDYDGKARYGLGFYFWNDTNGKVYGGHGGVAFGSRAKIEMCLNDSSGVILLWNQNNAIIDTILNRVDRPITNLTMNIIRKLLIDKVDS